MKDLKSTRISEAIVSNDSLFWSINLPIPKAVNSFVPDAIANLVSGVLGILLFKS